MSTYPNIIAAKDARITALEEQLAELGAENKRLKEALTAIDEIITSSIQENGQPHRLKIGDVWHIGPVVDALHSILMGLRMVARSALTAGGSDVG